MTTLFPVKNPDRLTEFRFCIQRNLENAIFDKIVILFEKWERDFPDRPGYEFLKDCKIEVVPMETRPRYKDFFDHAARHFAGHRIAICNTDIFFDESAMSAKVVPLGGDTDGCTQMMAITRYNYDPDTGVSELQGLAEMGGNTGSQDTWVFDAPLKPFDSDVVVGIIGCDSFIAQRAMEGGIHVLNPAMTVITRHLHRIGERNDTINGFTYWAHPQYAGVCIPFCAIKPVASDS